MDVCRAGAKERYTVSTSDFNHWSFHNHYSSLLSLIVVAVQEQQDIHFKVISNVAIQ